MRLKGKTALITGSSSGRRAVAESFAKEGASHIVINYPTSEQRADADAVVLSITDLGARTTAIEADVSREGAVATLVSGVFDFCRQLDILVNNAGVAHGEPVEDVATETWDQVIGVHLRGTFLVTRAVLPSMYQCNEGRIINTVSQLAYKGAPGLAAYTAAKGGILSFSRSLALEIGDRNIRVNCVAPVRQRPRSLTTYRRMSWTRFAPAYRSGISPKCTILPPPTPSWRQATAIISKVNASAQTVAIASSRKAGPLNDHPATLASQRRGPVCVCSGR